MQILIYNPNWWSTLREWLSVDADIAAQFIHGREMQFQPARDSVQNSMAVPYFSSRDSAFGSPEGRLIDHLLLRSVGLRAAALIVDRTSDQVRNGC
jgi:hypothetical protein